MSIKRKIEFNIRQRKIEVVFTNERLITPSGLSIVGGLLKKSEFVRLANRMPVKQKRSEPQIKNGDILLSYIGLLCQGKTEFEAVEEMRDDPDFFKDALGIKRGIPASETLRQESKQEWLERAKGCCKNVRHPREGKTVYVGASWKDVGYKTKNGEDKTICLRVGYEVIERTIDKKGQILLVPDIEVNTWWTNLGWTDDEIMDAYHAHGESEQYHNELKTDMDVERLPSGQI